MTSRPEPHVGPRPGAGDAGPRLRVIETTAEIDGGSDDHSLERRQRPHGLPRVSVVIPTLNEQKNLQHVLPGIPDWVEEVIIVDGRSTDDTIVEARRVLPRVRVLLEHQPGKGRALFTGIRAATGDIIVALDADGSMAAGDIPRYVYTLMAGADYVKGSRFVHGARTDDITVLRRLGNRGLTEIVRRIYGGRYSDLCYGYFGLWRDVVPYLEGHAPGFEVEAHINVRVLAAGLQVVEVPSFEAERIHGESNLNTVRDGVRVLRKIFTERRAFRDSTLPIPLPSRLAVAPPTRRGEQRTDVSSAQPAPSLSAVVCTHDAARWDALVRAVGSLRDQTVEPDEVIVVVDHNDDLLHRAKRELDGVQVIANGQRPGLSGARNTAIAAASHDVVAFLDDDAWAEPDWAERLLAAYSDPEVAGVGGTVEAYWATARPSWFPEEFDWVVGCTYRGMPTVRTEVRNAIGANMSFRRSALHAAGAFSELLGRVGHDGAGCEETELCIRMRQLDPTVRILFEPAARVHHEVPAHRASFEYFAKRCRAEGRSKANVSQLVGSADALSSERSYVWRTLPLGALRAIGPPVRLNNAGLGRAGALAAGLGMVGASYARGRRDLQSAAPDADQPALGSAGSPAAELPPANVVFTHQVTEPGEISAAVEISAGGEVSAADGVVDLELAAPLPDLVDVPELGIRSLVRVQGRPVGQVDLDGGRRRWSATDLAATIESTIGPDIARRVASLAVEPQALGAGGLVLPARPEPSTVPVPVTVVVATRDRAATLERCLDSLLAATPPPTAVVVVDSAPADDQARLLLERRFADDPRVAYVREARAGLGRAHNAALDLVRTPYIAFTDDDVVVDPGWLGSLADGFGVADHVACVTGLIAPAELRTREQWWVEQATGFSKGFDRRVRTLADSAGEAPLFPFNAGTLGSGANMAFTTAFLREVGGFDPSLGAGTRALGGDDLAAFHQVVISGYALVYEPDAVVYHRHHDQLAALRRQAFGYGAGLTAYLAHAVMTRPAAAAQIARRALPMVTWAFSPSSTAGVRRPADYPARLVWRERVGMTVGPARYLWQRRLDQKALAAG